MFFLLLGITLQTGLGYSPLAAGAALFPVTVLMLVGSARAGKLAQRIGPLGGHSSSGGPERTHSHDSTGRAGTAPSGRSADERHAGVARRPSGGGRLAMAVVEQ